MNKKISYSLITSILGGTGMLIASAAWADCTDPTGAVVTCNNIVSSPLSLKTIDQKATIEPGTQFSVAGTAVLLNVDGIQVTNNGSISTQGMGISAVSIQNALISNYGTVTTTGDSANAFNLVEDRLSTVENHGTLNTSDQGSHGIYAGPVDQTSILNTGNIITSGAQANGINVVQSSNSFVMNRGTITASGTESSGISLTGSVKNYTVSNESDGVIYARDGNGIMASDTTSLTNVFNKGIIDGGQAGMYLGGASQTGTLSNTGIIIGGGSGNGVMLADKSIVNQFDNHGLIGALTGDAIQVAPSSTVVGGINNEGIIVGRVNAPGSVMSNSGIFELLSSQQPSTVNTYVQNSKGVLALQADSTSSYGQLKVAGDASLNGRMLVVTRGSNSFANGDELMNVISAKNITGSPSGVLDDSLRYQFVQEQTGNSYSLKIVDTNLTTVSNAISTTSSNPALTSVGTAIDTIIEKNITTTSNLPGSIPASVASAPNCSGALASTICAITSSFNVDQIHKNVVQLAPLMDGSMPYIEMNNLRAFGDIVSSRQESVRGQGYTREFNPEKYLWIRPVGRWDNQSTRGDYAGYNADTRGIAIGADGQVLDRTRLGLALGISRTDVNDVSDEIRHDSRVDSWNMLAYGGFDFTPDTVMTWQTGFGRNTTKGNRYLNIENPTDGSTIYSSVAHSDYNSHTFQAGLGLQSTFHPMDVVMLTPEFRTDYYRVKDKGYQESGADDVGLKVDDATTEALVVSSKLKAGLRLSELVDIHGYVGAGYDTMNDRTEMKAAFIGSADTPFTYHGMSESPWIAMAGVGVTAKFSDVLDGNIQYDAEQRTKFTSQSVSLKVRYAF